MEHDALKAFHRLALEKPDGRKLYLYSRRPIDATLRAPMPPGEVSERNPHLRWHPLRGEWVAYAAYRQNRAFLPPKEFNPLAPTTTPEAPTELPAGDYDVAVFENLSPTLARTAHSPPESIVPTREAKGACEVVVFTKDPESSLSRLSLDHVELVLDVWVDRWTELGAEPGIDYVMPFENRGIEMGVTLSHPHGQIYAYAFVPPIPAKMLEREKRYREQNNRGLLEEILRLEIEDSRRLIYKGPESIAFVPAFARYPYETWIAPRRPVPSLAALRRPERHDLAIALRRTLLKLDGLWNRPMPYLMVLYQAPTDGVEHPEAHAHFEIYPALRTENRLKFLAGTELGAGLFANDSLPEEKAAELRAVDVTAEERRYG